MHKSQSSKNLLLKPTAAIILALAANAALAATTPVMWADTATKAFVKPAAVSNGKVLAATTAQAELSAGEATHIVVSLKLRNTDDMKRATADIYNKKSPRFHHFVDHAGFMALYAPTQKQVDSVVAYLQKNGFVNIEVAPNNLLISADGNAATVKAAFNTPLVKYQLADRVGYANSQPAQVPQALAGTVKAVLGLQSVSRAKPMYKRGPITTGAELSSLALQPQATGTARGHQPTDFPSIYDATSLPTGAGTTVAIIAIGGVAQTLTDLSNAGYGSVSTRVVKTGSSRGNYSDDPDGIGEWNLDSQSILGAAGGAVKQMVFYEADLNASGNSGLTAAFNRAVSDNTAKVINVSLGWCETDAYDDGTVDAEDGIFQSATLQGQTFSVSSGDEGTYECNNRGVPDKGTYSVSWPASSPYVIAVGGSTIYTTGTKTWARETVWNEGVQSNKLWATGGGVSVVEAIPDRQSVLNSGQDGRLLPDVTFDAAQGTGALIYVDGSQEQIGGTSLASPLFVGFWARIESDNGNSIGFPADQIYSAFSSTPSLLHDITSGNNGSGGYGYKAAVGWDYPTGWGSVDIARFDKWLKTN